MNQKVLKTLEYNKIIHQLDRLRGFRSGKAPVSEPAPYE